MTVRINFKLLYIFIVLFFVTCAPDVKEKAAKTVNKKKQQVKITIANTKLKTQTGGQAVVKVAGPTHTTILKPVSKAKPQQKTAIKNNSIAGISIIKKDKLKAQTTVPESNVKNIFPESSEYSTNSKTNNLKAEAAIPGSNIKNIFPESSEYSANSKTNNLKAEAAIPGSNISYTNQGDSAKVAMHDTISSSTTTSVAVAHPVDTSSTRPDTKPVSTNADKIIASIGDESLKPDALLFRGNTFERALKMKMDSLANATMPEFTKQSKMMPNDAMQSVMTPSGFGGYGTYLFGGLGGVYPAVYTNKVDLIASIGFCVGNSDKAINFAASTNIGKVHNLSDLTANFIVSRRVFTGSSISLGGLQLLASSILSDAPGETFYFAFSHSIQTIPSKTPGYSALTYTIGIGNGRFWQKSPDDIAAGRGKYGTGVFGNISYEVMRRVNLNAEWTGMNLGISTGIRPLAGSPFSLGVGLTDLTRYSSDKPSMIFSMGYPLSLTR